MKEAFVYRWNDVKTGMYYIGRHKGNLDDGYICSSGYMLTEYRKRPQDFQRTIIFEGALVECQELEMILLKFYDVPRDPLSYNQAITSEDFIHKFQTEKSRKQISMTLKGRSPWNKGKSLPAKMRNNISLSNKGRVVTEETREKMSAAKKGKKFSKEHKENLRISHLGQKGYWLGRKHPCKRKSTTIESS